MTGGEASADAASAGHPRLRARLAVEPERLDDARRPEAGPISIVSGGEGTDAAYADVIRAAGGEVVPLGDATRGVVCLDNRQVTGLVAALTAHPDISWVQLPFAGIDAFAAQLRPFADRGVVFTSAKGAYAEPVAEHALALTLASLRLLPMRARAESWGPKGGRTLFGADVVVVGAGGIALSFLDLVRPFRCRTTVVRRSAAPVEGADRTVTDDRLGEVLADADVVVLAAAATDATRGLIGADELRAMRSTAVLVNVARGALVDTDALVDALDAGELWGAGLDVTEPEPLPAGHPLYSNERSVVTPHTADTPEMVGPLLQERIAVNVRAFLDGGAFTGLADPRLGY